MTGDNGFYLMHRGWMENPVLRAGARELDRCSAWCWLIENARWAPGEVMIAGHLVTLERGQLSHSFRYLARAWGWSEPKVRRYCVALASASMIRCASEAGQTVITICNYETYQALERVGDAPTDAPATQHRRSTDANKNQGNQSNQKKEERGPTDSGEAPGPLASKIPNDLIPDAVVLTMPPDECDRVVDAWNAMAARVNRQRGKTVISEVAKLTDTRRRSLRLRMAEAKGAANVEAIILKVEASDFLTGKVKAWALDFDGFINLAKFTKIREGAFDNRGGPAGKHDWIAQRMGILDPTPPDMGGPILDHAPGEAL